MRIRRHLQHQPQACVATIGNFDGVHQGHEAVINTLVEEGNKRGLPTVVMVFEPHPLEYFRASLAPPRLTEFREKVRQFKRLGLDEVLVLPFNGDFAAQSPEAFVEDVLVRGMAVQFVLVGDDFRFGKQRQGDFKLLQHLADKWDFTVKDSESYCLGEQRISSTSIRAALAKADLANASLMLGRPFTMSGRVIYGAQRGRSIGFPTANIGVRRVTLPLNGVFTVTVEDEAGMIYSGVANVGKRPTVDGQRNSLEVHIFDFQGDLYGEHLCVEFKEFIRPEMKFNSLDELKSQIQSDAERARAFFQHNK